MKYIRPTYTAETDDRTGALIRFQSHGVDMITPIHPFLELRMLRPDGTMVFLTNADGITLVTPRADGYTVQVTAFTGFDGLTVIVTVDAADDGLVYRTAVENPTDAYVEQLACPCVAVSEQFAQQPGNGQIFWAHAEGVLIDDVRHCVHDRIRRVDPESVTVRAYPGYTTMQYMAYLEDGAGLYFGVHDPSGMPKVFTPNEEDGTVRLNVRLMPCIAPHSDWVSDFPTVLMPIDGNWEAAAEQYRQFVESGAFALPPKVRENPKIPEWVQTSPVVVIYPPRSVRGTGYMGPNEFFPYVNGIKYLADIGEAVDSRIMAFLAYWEGSAPWGTPFVWPPYGGEEIFADYVTAMHARGDLVALYCSGLHWTDQHHLVPEYNMTRYRELHGLTEKMCRLPDQRLKPGICGEIRSGYTMCCACDETKAIAYDQLGKMLDAQVDYIQYFDQHMGGEGFPCYAKDHGHPACHGKWNSDAMAAMYRNIGDLITEKRGESGAAFGAEGAPADCFCGAMYFNDNRWNVNYRFGAPVPAYSYVLHEYTSNFSGNQCGVDHVLSRAENPDSILHSLAYGFIAGDALTLVMKSGGEIHYDWGLSWLEPGPRQAPVKTLTRNLNAMRRGAANRFLIGGRMCPTAPFDSPARFRMTRRDGTVLDCPAVLSSCWQDGEDRVQLFANYRHEPLTVRLHTPCTSVIASDGSAVSDSATEITVPALDCVMCVLK